ncbi:OB-fold domain-containing protein [Frankia sp. CH37]|nr:OB-fold domain-containing protein [Parafrankia sp. CH37]
MPVPDDVSAPYWAAAARHVLAVARCSRCDAYAIPPDVVCPHCHSTAPDFVFQQVSGRGEIRSWTVMRQSFLPGFAADIPFVLVDVELVEQAGLRMIGRLLDGPGAAPSFGAPVRVAFEDLPHAAAVPAFVLDARA